MYHYTFLGNCPPTPPISQHFAQVRSVNAALGKGEVGSFPEMYNDTKNVSLIFNGTLEMCPSLLTAALPPRQELMNIPLRS